MIAKDRELEWKIRGKLALTRPEPIRRDPEKRLVLAMLTADYGNLGDLAIAEAQVSFLREQLPDAQVVEVPIGQTLTGIRTWAPQLGSGDLVTLTGGGNLGDLYPNIELLRQSVVAHFRQVPIISFPQSFYFTDTDTGRRSLRRAQRVYGSHPRLTWLARDRGSQAQMTESFAGNEVVGAPDVVVTRPFSAPLAPATQNLQWTIRNDSEAATAQSFTHALRTAAQERHSVIEYDTHLGSSRSHVSIAERPEVLREAFGRFQGARAVITDRLHGTIFSIVTRRPVLVMDNADGKIRRFVDSWLADCPWVRFLDNPSPAHVDDYLDSLLDQHPTAETPEKLKDLFETTVAPLLHF